MSTALIQLSRILFQLGPNPFSITLCKLLIYNLGYISLNDLYAIEMQALAFRVTGNDTDRATK
jgi:hypothetical protein